MAYEYFSCGYYLGVDQKVFEECNNCYDKSIKYCEYNGYIYLGYHNPSGQEYSCYAFISGQSTYSEGYDYCKSYIESRCDGQVSLTKYDNKYYCYFKCESQESR